MSWTVQRMYRDNAANRAENIAINRAYRENPSPGSLAAFVAHERFAWPGGYELFAVTDDGGILCHDCCRREGTIISDSFHGDGWHVVAVDNMSNHDEPQGCDNCGRIIR